MLSQCIAALCVFGIVVIGLLVTVQAISLEQAASTLGRVFLLLILTLTMLCMVKSLIVPMVVAAMMTLQRLLAWFVGTALVVLVGIFTIRWLVFMLNKRSRSMSDNERGEP